MTDKYVVYFDATTNNCSGWLDMSNHDVAVFCHSMLAADVFESEEEARKNAEEYRKRIFDLIDRVPQNPRYTKADKERHKQMYRYWILRIDGEDAGKIAEVRNKINKRMEEK